jgi:uncharacterized protein YigA (DUF484 family)
VETAISTPDEVARYLREHPEFFIEQGSLLAELRLPHGHAEGTVSLLERQRELLRERVTTLDTHLQQLLAAARANEVIAGRMRRLVRRLLRAPTRADALAGLEESLDAEFGLVDVRLLVFGLGAMGLPASRFVVAVDRSDPALQSIDAVLAGGRPVCGPLRDSQREAVFGADRPVASAALVPVGEGSPVALLVLGSDEEDRFTADMGTDVLVQLAEVTGEVLSRA